MVLVSILGIGSLTGWINWRMRQLLVESHKDNALMIASRLGQDVDLYGETMPISQAMAMAIDYRKQPDVAIWVTSPQGEILAQSDTLSMGSWQINGFAQALLEQVSGKLGLEVIRLQGRHLVTCSSPLEVNGQVMGELYVVDDITEDQETLSRITRTLAFSSLLAIGVGAIATAFYTRQSLAPIRKMNRLAANVSTDNLASTRLEFDRAPTEVQELAQACNMMISRLSAAWDQQRRFVSDVSHELRTPLTLVHGYLQSTLRRCNNLSSPQREGLEIAAAEADRTIRLLQDLLDLARADGGHLRFQIERQPLEAVVQEVLEMGQYVSDRIHADLEPVEARVDRHRLKQVLINLMDNAMKYSNDNEPIRVGLKKIGDRAYIEVSDHGRGIPLADLTKIFDPFYRVDEDRSRATGGTGLGLSIVKTLVEGMNGTLKVQSKLGEGSVFTVSLPI
ncbi:HAMP domain-containing sensor histidine kinase [Leptolyngbya sp. BC1307]|uniref:HAMP domain-containing sensor histidine kinase n=1 Tax=Leptolyngbya sp. BC1307 TaxID=2029589 RepID=UPI001F0AFD2E|nr:HAMP domain-containing sensor histidine kinase [Leptolyngbya sp. BC1307]